MKLFRLVSMGSLALLGLVLDGCLAEPTYSKVPEISANSVNLTLLNAGTPNVTAHTEITINYQDGDGDLGLTNAEANAAPYAGTRFTNNFFVNPYVKDVTGNFVPLSSSGRGVLGNYNQTFVHATSAADNHSMPIKGTLTWTYDFPLYSTFPLLGEEVQFHVSIADRAMNESNVIIVPVTFK